MTQPGTGSVQGPPRCPDGAVLGQVGAAVSHSSLAPHPPPHGGAPVPASPSRRVCQAAAGGAWGPGAAVAGSWCLFPPRQTTAQALVMADPIHHDYGSLGRSVMVVAAWRQAALCAAGPAPTPAKDEGQRTGPSLPLAPCL